MVMHQHRLRFLLGGISVGHQESGLLRRSLYLPVDGIETVDNPFHLCRDAEIIHRLRTEFLKVVVENTWPVHAATVAGAARLHLLESTVETEHVVPFFFRAFDELWLKACTIPVPATAVPKAASADFFRNSRRSIGVRD